MRFSKFFWVGLSGFICCWIAAQAASQEEGRQEGVHKHKLKPSKEGMESDQPEQRRPKSSSKAERAEKAVTYSPKVARKKKEGPPHDEKLPIFVTRFDPIAQLPFVDDGSQAEIDLESIHQNLPEKQSRKEAFFGTWPPNRRNFVLPTDRSTSFQGDGTQGAQYYEPQFHPQASSFIPECWMTESEPTLILDPVQAGWGFAGNLQMELVDHAGNTLRRYVGSANLIGPNVLVTAGHNLYSRALETGFSRVTFFAAQTGTHIPYTAEAESFVVDPGYISGRGDEYKKHDIGIVILKQPIGRDVGWASFGHMPDEELATRVFDMVGYPSSVLRAGKAETVRDRQMFHVAGSVISLTPDQVFHGANTSQGHSGSGLLDEGKCIRAIHAYGGTLDTGNCATRISQTKEDLIKEWMRDHVSSQDSPAFSTRSFGLSLSKLREEKARSVTRSVKLKKPKKTVKRLESSRLSLYSVPRENKGHPMKSASSKKGKQKKK